MDEQRDTPHDDHASVARPAAEWDVRSRVDSLQQAAYHSEDPVLLSIATAAEQVFTQLTESSEKLDRCRRELLAQLTTHQILDERMQEVLEIARRLDRSDPSGPEPVRPTETLHRRRPWWRRHRATNDDDTLPRPHHPVRAEPATGDGRAGGGAPSADSGEHRSAAVTTSTPTPRRRRTDRDARDRRGSDGGTATGGPDSDDGAYVGRDAAALAAHMLGPFALLQHGNRVLQTYGPKTQTLLKFLLAHRGRSVPRDVLVELLWPDLDPESGRRNLHQTVYALRRSLRAADPLTQHVCFKNDGYALGDDLTLWCDVWEFEAAADQGRRSHDAGADDAAIAAYGAAAALYRGEYLADSPYDEWTVVDRERLRMRHHEVMEALGGLLFAHGRWDDAIAAGQRLLRHDPLAEDAHRLIMAAYRARGQRSLAIQQYRICSHALQRELGMSPSPDTEELYRELLA